MDCKHERLRTVGDRLFCCECNKELPIEFLTAKNGKNQPVKTAPAESTDKPAAKTRRPKKAV